MHHIHSRYLVILTMLLVSKTAAVSAFASTAPDFGPNVIVFDPSMPDSRSASRASMRCMQNKRPAQFGQRAVRALLQARQVLC